MIKISLEEFESNLDHWLDNVPLIVTVDGEDKFVVISYDEYKELNEQN